MNLDGGRVCWITGLSGAGKSTLAAVVTSRLRDSGESVIMLDGDELRDVFGAAVANSQNHGREGRMALAMQYAHLCRVLAGQGFTVVIATISLFTEVHTHGIGTICPGISKSILGCRLMNCAGVTRRGFIDVSKPVS